MYIRTTRPLGGCAGRLTPRPQPRKKSSRDCSRRPLDFNFQRQDEALILIYYFFLNLTSFPLSPRPALPARHVTAGRARAAAAVAPARCGGAAGHGRLRVLLFLLVPGWRRRAHPAQGDAGRAPGHAAHGWAGQGRCRRQAAPRRAGPQPRGAARGNRWESRFGATLAGIGAFL